MFWTSVHILFCGGLSHSSKNINFEILLSNENSERLFFFQARSLFFSKFLVGDANEGWTIFIGQEKKTNNILIGQYEMNKFHSFKLGMKYFCWCQDFIDSYHQHKFFCDQRVSMQIPPLSDFLEKRGGLSGGNFFC